MKLIPMATIKKLAEKHRINLNHGSPEYWQLAASTELDEHGHLFNHNPEIGFMIALDHIKEFRNYYEWLYKMEDELKAFWKGKKQPSL